MSPYLLVQDEVPGKTAFNTLPIELNKAIAHYLPTDTDVATFRLICKNTNDAIDADKGSFWRARFREKYDLNETVSNKDLCALYQRRAKFLRWALRSECNFFWGQGKKERFAVKILRGLIVEAFQGRIEVDERSKHNLRSKNQIALVDFIRRSKFLLNDRRPPTPDKHEQNGVNPMLAAVKLMCLPLLSQLKDVKHHVFAVEELQRAVYAPTNAAPMYKGPDHTTVNMEWALQCMNFFRHHMTNQEVVTLFDAIDELPANQRPTAWQEPLRTGAHKLSRYWKGTYAYLDPVEIRKLRSLNDAANSYFTDLNVDEGKIQSMELKFVDQGTTALPWPALFEHHLHSLRGVPRASQLKTQGRSQPRDATTDSLQFVGTGTDLDDDFQAMGWLNPLPAQEGIPGWQRITFMKHFRQDETADWEEDNLWAYEGVVLPGGKIILGRWWFAASGPVDFDSDYNGPFIFWAAAPDDLDLKRDVDGEAGDDEWAGMWTDV